MTEVAEAVEVLPQTPASKLPRVYPETPFIERLISVLTLASSVSKQDYRSLMQAERSAPFLRSYPDRSTNKLACLQAFQMVASKVLDSPYLEVCQLLVQKVDAHQDVEMAETEEDEFEPATSLESRLATAWGKGLTSSPAIELLLGSLLLTYLLDEGMVQEAYAFTEPLLARVDVLKQNRRSVDRLVAHIYFHSSRVYQAVGELPKLRSLFLGAFRFSVLHHDKASQAVLINLLLRNYLEGGSYDVAHQFAQATQFPESAANAQQARYAYYMGRIQAIRLEYEAAHASLLQAIRKAPQTLFVATGFRGAATQLLIAVELLSGQIPDLQLFRTPDLAESLEPYFKLTAAVRVYDLRTFEQLLTDHETRFKADQTLSLLRRVRYNVIKTGIRDIALSYSRISLEDVRLKLGLANIEDVTNAVSKAISDGAIDFEIDPDLGILRAKPEASIFLKKSTVQVLDDRIRQGLSLFQASQAAFTYPETTQTCPTKLGERSTNDDDYMEDED